MAILTYVPSNKDLKLIWESGPTTGRILEMLRPLRDLATEESISFSFAGRIRTFYVLNIGSKNIRQFQERVRACRILFHSELSTWHWEAWAFT